MDFFVGRVIREHEDIDLFMAVLSFPWVDG
jgi:hypothetical protein